MDSHPGKGTRGRVFEIVDGRRVDVTDDDASEHLEACPICELSIDVRDPGEVMRHLAPGHKKLPPRIVTNSGPPDTAEALSEPTRCSVCDGEGWVCEDHPLTPWVTGMTEVGIPCRCNPISRMFPGFRPRCVGDDEDAK